MPVQFAYSLNGEDYRGSFQAREAALLAAVATARLMPEPPSSVYVARMISVAPRTAGHARTVLSEMAAHAREEIGDAGLRYLANVTSEQIDDLDDELNKALERWLQRNNLTPTFFRVEAISEHPIPALPENHLFSRSPNGGADSEVHDLGAVESFAAN